MEISDNPLVFLIQVARKIIEMFDVMWGFLTYEIGIPGMFTISVWQILGGVGLVVVIVARIAASVGVTT
jgi:hypothetical protein